MVISFCVLAALGLADETVTHACCQHGQPGPPDVQTSSWLSGLLGDARGYRRSVRLFLFTRYFTAPANTTVPPSRGTAAPDRRYFPIVIRVRDLGASIEHYAKKMAFITEFYYPLMLLVSSNLRPLDQLLQSYGREITEQRNLRTQKLSDFSTHSICSFSTLVPDTSQEALPSGREDDRMTNDCLCKPQPPCKVFSSPLSPSIRNVLGDSPQESVSVQMRDLPV